MAAWPENSGQWAESSADGVSEYKWALQASTWRERSNVVSDRTGSITTGGRLESSVV